MNRKKLSWKSILAWLLVSFFFVGAMGNIFVSENIAADYARWRYPDWFHYVTGSLELITAILLALRSSRLWGALLGSLVMVGAILTLLVHQEFGHAIAPLIVLFLSGVTAWANRTARGGQIIKATP